MKSWLTDNLLLKTLSLALAIGIWLVVIGENEVEFSVPAPLVLQGLPDAMALAAPPPDQVTVRLRAPEALRKGLGTGDINALLNLSSLGPGEHLIPLRHDQVRVPFGAKLLSVTPDVVPLKIEPRVSREVPVEVRVEGQLAEGFVLGRVDVDPPKVAVEGPAGVVSAVGNVSTERVVIGGRRESFTTHVSVLSGNPLLRVAGDSEVEVSVSIAPIAR
ncbi:MAG: CdaR family protein [Acidobacteriota bacterium]